MWLYDLKIDKEEYPNNTIFGNGNWVYTYFIVLLLQWAKGFIYKMIVAKAGKKKWLQGIAKLDREEIKLEHLSSVYCEKGNS